MILDKKLLLIFTTSFLLLLSSGCSVLGPNYQKAEKITFPKTWDTNISKDDKNIKEWWKLFNDETLNLLVQETYEQNLDLRSAGLRILQARAALGLSQGLNYPQVQTLSGSIAGTRSSGSNFVASGMSFDVGWEMDIWGKYARNIESSEATLYASIASYDDILVSLIAEVARNYINLRTAQQRSAFAERNIKIQKRVTKMTKVQFNAGNVSELDMQQALTQLYTTQSILPALKLSQIKSRNAIAVLLGKLPQELNTLLQTKDVDTLEAIPTIALADNFHINADIVRRRPDLQVAEYQARAQNARIGATQAELYPSFSLFGSLGYSTTNAGNAISLSVGPAFSWNIFQYGRIKNQVRIQDAKFQESLTNYNKKVLLAVFEVSSALDGYKLTKEQLVLNKQAVNATSRAYKLSATQYENGLVTYQRLLSTVDKLTRTEDAYAQIKGNIALQVVALYKALGGGWQIHNTDDYLNTKDKKALQDRGIDWSNYLEEDKAKNVQ